MNNYTELFENTVSNTFTLGNKKYAYIPISLLYADSRFQRVEFVTAHEVNALESKWDDNKMDAIKVSIHPEEERYSILDGFHRFSVLQRKDTKHVVCEIIDFSDKTPEERLVEEAKFFSTQQTKRLTPAEKHKSCVIRNVKENVIIDKVAKKYGIKVKDNAGRGKTKVGVIACFSKLLEIASVTNEEMVDRIFNIICSSKWDLDSLGFSEKTILPIYTVLRLHSQNKNKITKEMISMFKEINPETLYSRGVAKYPTVKTKRAISMYLEDVICEKLDIPVLYELEQREALKVVA